MEVLSISHVDVIALCIIVIDPSISKHHAFQLFLLGILDGWVEMDRTLSRSPIVCRDKRKTVERKVRIFVLLQLFCVDIRCKFEKKREIDRQIDVKSDHKHCFWLYIQNLSQPRELKYCMRRST
jgi:hypothetical protein